MKERGIVYTREMVRAVICKVDPKTKTRRVIRPQPGRVCDAEQILWPKKGGGWSPEPAPCPYGQPGDRLWVRESYTIVEGEALYRADWTDEQIEEEKRARRLAPKLAAGNRDKTWRSGRFMPRSLSRITLEIVSVGVERLQDISTEEVIAEGVQLTAVPSQRDSRKGVPILRITGKYPPHEYTNKHVRDWTLDDWWRTHFASLWDSINGKRPGCAWHDNPWVWVIGFRCMEPTA